MIQVPYGKTSLTAQLPAVWQVQTIAPRPAEAATDPAAVIQNALAHPVGGIHLEDFKGARSAAIAINDKTRPVPHADLLPPLLERLHAIGIPPQNITFVIANGTHPPMPPTEYGWVLPAELVEKYPIVSHDAYAESALVELGKTERGTPVFINRAYMEADLRLVVGNIEPHQFMGFSGGVKSVAIGLAGKDTINANHAWMRHQDARLGQYAPNPAREDVEEIGRMIRVDFALNALLNGTKQIVAAVAGAPLAVMQAAIPQVREIFQVPVAAPFDVVIASPGGHPKDINIYQAQKALAHAALITKTGGTVILVAACPEGSGSSTYENWMVGMESYTAVFERFAREGFQIGAHKAFQIARDAAQVHTILVSEMPPDFVQGLLLHPAPSLQAALDSVLATQDPTRTQIGVMPAANATIPLLLEAKP